MFRCSSDCSTSTWHEAKAEQLSTVYDLIRKRKEGREVGFTRLELQLFLSFSLLVDGIEAE